MPAHALHTIAATLLAGALCATPAVAATTGTCPQPRATAQAPASYQGRRNPLPATAENLARGRELYERGARPVACAHCHGVDGGGYAPGAAGLEPEPRNFRCRETMATITDGQMYWIIEYGSGALHTPFRQGAQAIDRPGRRSHLTAMRGHRDYLSDADIWAVILYIRSFPQTP